MKIQYEKVIHYFLLKMKLRNQEVRDILKEYTLGDFIFKKLIYNAWNTAYHLRTSKGEFLLKTLNFQTEKGLLKEINISVLLKDKIPSDFFIISKNKNPYIHYKDSIVLIKNFIKGKSVSEGKNLPLKNLRELGKYYGVIHSLQTTASIPQKNLYAEVQKFFNEIDTSSPEHTIAQSIFALLKAHGFEASKFPHGLIHADLHTQNLLIHKSQIVAILDFEDAHIGAYIYDLGLSIWDICWKIKDFSVEKITIFIKSYESKRVLTMQEKQHLFDAVMIMGLNFLSFSIMKNGVGHKNNLKYIKKLTNIQRSPWYARQESNLRHTA